MNLSLPPADATSVVARYDTLVAANTVEDDPAQRRLAARLDRLRSELDQPWRPGLLARLAGRRRAPVTGLYIHGPVGRGKSMLMDLFVATRPPGARRVHFHQFMAEVHEQVYRIRRSNDRRGTDSPILPVADAIAAASPVLCFDEFAVNDIGDAMILGRLFTRLFDLGVVVVATSNIPPDDLYRGGLNRGHFLPFIALLKQRMAVFELDARTDFRLEKLAGAPVYVTPLGDTARTALDDAFVHLTGGHGGPRTVTVGTRNLTVPEARSGVARFDFADLCETPLGARDFLVLAGAFHTVLVDNIPVIPPERRDIAKRFITLIDTLYDCRVKLIASAAAEPDALYAGRIGAEAHEFARTVSRLVEMRSKDYLDAPHGPISA